MSISIVTAFFDIGRGDWTPDKGLPHYLHRTTDTYIERFGHLATLENEITVNWNQMVAEFLYWAQTGWETGSIITINPSVSLAVSKIGKSNAAPFAQ